MDTLNFFVIHTVQSIKNQEFWRNSWLLAQKTTLIFLQLTHPRIPTEAAGANFRGSGRRFPAWRRCSGRALQGVHGQLKSGLRRLLGAMGVSGCKKINESTPPSRSCRHRNADRRCASPYAYPRGGPRTRSPTRAWSLELRHGC